jgi:DNA-binding transcriptional LysR family regulator
VKMEDAWCAERLHALQRFGSWSDLGFQGKDPCTDFRGSGRLGLDTLHAMCQSMPDTVLQLLHESRDHHTAYPFACAVINVAHRCFAALQRGQLDAAMRCGGYHDHAFHGVVARAACRSASAPCAARDTPSVTFPLQAARFVEEQPGFPRCCHPAARLTCDSVRRSPRASWSSHSTWTGREPLCQRLFLAASRQSLVCV